MDPIDRKLFHLWRKKASARARRSRTPAGDGDDGMAGPGPGSAAAAAAAKARQRSGLRRGTEAGSSGGPFTTQPNVRQRKAVSRAYNTLAKAAHRVTKRLNAKHGVTAHILIVGVMQGCRAQPRVFVTQPCMAAMQEPDYFESGDGKAVLSANPKASLTAAVTACVQAAAAGTADGRAPPTDAGVYAAAHAHATCHTRKHMCVLSYVHYVHADCASYPCSLPVCMCAQS